jgi:hypothetical protein
MTNLESDILHSLVHKTSPAYKKVFRIREITAQILKDGKFGDTAIVEMREILTHVHGIMNEFDEMAKTLLTTGGSNGEQKVVAK